ncbi:MAG: 3-deoxy-manno-octulosonate cytidylyltransferase [Armatimonadetes bacterium]|nr:3-deoxy-manno-octulosonate cytidylyltransferase [Armatimonadota bacterium]
MRCMIVIPARMGSTRFPGKPLVDLCGRPMIQWVVEAAQVSGVADRILVATPDPEIVEACARFGAEAVLTRADHPSGTDRIAEVAESRIADVYVNVQGDEPLIKPETIRACADPMLNDAAIQMASVFSECEPEEVEHPAVVKVVTDRAGYALYFSRYAIPFERIPRVAPVKKHVGIYGYTRKALMDFATWPPSPLEQTESLEQLRFLENGVRIFMAEGAGSELAVDTPEQAEEVRRILEGG